MIDEKKLMEWIRQAVNDGRYDEYKPAAVLCEVWDMIKELPKVGEWIPVSERLPEEYESVLFSTHFGGVKFGYITSYREWKDEAEGYTHCDDEVTAWQPIPEPWKGDANGEDD